MKLRNLKFLWNLWPPFLGLGISVKISTDFKKTTVTLKKRFWNANYFGAQYGGGIFAMTDGIHMLMLIQNLPKNYRIWDKSANIHYLKRGLTTLTADFLIREHDLKQIESDLTQHASMDWSATVNIKDETGQIVAKVTRVLSIKRKTI